MFCNYKERFKQLLVTDNEKRNCYTEVVRRKLRLQRYWKHSNALEQKDKSV